MLCPALNSTGSSALAMSSLLPCQDVGSPPYLLAGNILLSSLAICIYLEEFELADITLSAL